MGDLIRRKDALQAIAQLPLPYGVQRDKIITAIYEVPAVDAAPVVHGDWGKPFEVDAYHIGYRCSRCGYQAVPFKYCPECGAKMDGGADHGR